MKRMFDLQKCLMKNYIINVFQILKKSRMDWQMQLTISQRIITMLRLSKADQIGL